MIDKEDAMRAGQRVKLTKDVERYPHFIAECGRAGVITCWKKDQISVRLDEPLSGAEPWNNEVQWYDDMLECASAEEAFRGDTEAAPPC